MTNLSFKKTLVLLGEELRFTRQALNALNFQLPWNKDPNIEAKFKRAVDRVWFRLVA